MNDLNPVRVLIVVDSFHELSQALVKARIALKLSQKELADRPEDETVCSLVGIGRYQSLTYCIITNHYRR